MQKRSPDIKLIIATTAPRWLLEEYIEGDFVYHQRVFDVGVIQLDSLQVDREATFASWERIYTQQADLIAEEVIFLQENQVDLIFGDIPDGCRDCEGGKNSLLDGWQFWMGFYLSGLGR